MPKKLKRNQSHIHSSQILQYHDLKNNPASYGGNQNGFWKSVPAIAQILTIWRKIERFKEYSSSRYGVSFTVSKILWSPGNRKVKSFMCICIISSWLDRIVLRTLPYMYACM